MARHAAGRGLSRLLGLLVVLAVLVTRDTLDGAEALPALDQRELAPALVSAAQGAEDPAYHLLSAGDG
jgi:hypothetical protein